jgi:hypothetical protein
MFLHQSAIYECSRRRMGIRDGLRSSGGVEYQLNPCSCRTVVFEGLDGNLYS